jgi:predicted aspartyl protease
MTDRWWIGEKQNRRRRHQRVAESKGAIMLTQGVKKVGRFYVELDLANNGDVVEAERGHLPLDKVRRVKVRGLVDSGASRLVLPRAVAEQLGLETTAQVKVRYADGRSGKRPVVEGVYLELLGRHGVFTATVEAKRDTALIGAIVLEDLDFLIDPLKQCLYPRDPKFVVSEVG